MGVTYRAYDERLRLEVALKVITPGQVDDPKTRALFLREARAAARVHHPNVSSVVYLSDAPENVFYAMEFVAGESLAEWLRTRGALPPAMAVGFALQMARGLGAIHAQHIVHRDLKPANLMIVEADGSKGRRDAATSADAWQLKIIDFGLARRFDGASLDTALEARTTGFRGTTLYASPEQCEERRELDGRSDQYSLGCILWEMLTGSPPFRGVNHRELLNQHVAVPPPREPIAHLLAEVQALLGKMLAKDPDDRFEDTDALIVALERCRETLRVSQATDVGQTTSLPASAGAWKGKLPGWLPRAALIAGMLVAAGAIWWFARGRAPAVAAKAPSPAPAAVTTPAGAPVAPSRKSIAVLPFENLSGRPEDAYLADGLQEEILNSLARVRDLKVISRTSVMEYRGKAPNIREVGKRLGVGTVLEGSVRREGNTLRLTVQLIDTRDDTHLFAANYDRDVNKVLDLQSAVARQVTEALTATLTRQDRGELDRVATNNGDAYDRYLRAVALYRREKPGDPLGLIEPKRLLEEALSFDPNYADADALLSQVNTWAYFNNARSDDAVAAKDALERAFANDPKLPEVQLARGMYAIYVSKDLEQALADLGAVVRLRPNSALAHLVLGVALRRIGRMDEALEHFVRADDLDPLNGGYMELVLTTLLGLRRYPEAIRLTELATSRFPTDPETYFFRAVFNARLRNSSEPLQTALRDHGGELTADARRGYEVWVARMDGRYRDAIKILNEIPVSNALQRSLYLGCLYYAAGDLPSAEENFLRAETLALEMKQRDPKGELRGYSPEQFGLVLSMLGKHAEALAVVERARAMTPESRDKLNGPRISFIRSIVLVRAGRTEEGYAEVERLLRVPFGAPLNFEFSYHVTSLITKDDPHFDELINHPPRL